MAAEESLSDMQSDTGDGARKGDLALLTVVVMGFGECSATDPDCR